MIQGLRTAIYFVNDIEKAKTWYTKLLGKPPYFDTPFYVGYNVGGFELGLHPATEEQAAGNSIAYWGVKDARAEYEALLNNGATPHEAVTDVGEGILIGSVTDPLGNIFGIIENPHFKYEP